MFFFFIQLALRQSTDRVLPHKDENVAAALSDDEPEVSRQRIRGKVEAAFNKTLTDEFFRTDDIRGRLNKQVVNDGLLIANSKFYYNKTTQIFQHSVWQNGIPTLGLGLSVLFNGNGRSDGNSGLLSIAFSHGTVDLLWYKLTQW